MDWTHNYMRKTEAWSLGTAWFQAAPGTIQSTEMETSLVYCQVSSPCMHTHKHIHARAHTHTQINKALCVGDEKSPLCPGHCEFSINIVMITAVYIYDYLYSLIQFCSPWRFGKSCSYFFSITSSTIIFLYSYSIPQHGYNFSNDIFSLIRFAPKTFCLVCSNTTD